MPNAVNFLNELLTNKRKLDEALHIELNAVCSAILQNKLPNKLNDLGSFTIPRLIGSLDVHHALADLGETVSKNTYEPCSNNNKGPIYEERMLQIEELDEWRTQKLRTPDEPKLSQDKLNTSPNQLKVGDKVLLDAADPRFATPEPNEEIPLTVLSIFPYGTVEVIHSKFGTFKFLTSNILIESWNTDFQKTTRPDTQACIRPCENRARFFPNTGCNKLPRPCDMAVDETAKTTQALDTPMPQNRECNMGVRHAHAIHPWSTLSKQTRTWTYVHGRGRSE
ncbi:hypothetical protein GOBAR_AA10993 [Gossypium barbadense]|uniref:Uncharacterized protein n=1 Tax=Gossypium barbadense TaxID=3634 RepID=A0A2P5Y234_GOSBA|nr:hypothetical protein GOBAR_AA10993 [Gossypium barbadense]